MGDVLLPRITVDFNYGGRRETGEGVTMLNSKFGDRTGLNPRFRQELVAAGVQPEEGMSVRLVEPKADLDDHGRLCDMEVDAQIFVHPGGEWAAVWNWDAVDWVPSKPQSSP
jgi:hypothetical protein